MTTHTKSIDNYVARIQAHILKRYPSLQMEVVRRSDTEAVIYFSADNEEQEYPIIKRAGNLATDALVEMGFRIHVLPGPLPSRV